MVKDEENKMQENMLDEIHATVFVHVLIHGVTEGGRSIQANHDAWQGNYVLLYFSMSLH